MLVLLLIHAARPEETFTIGLSPSVPRSVYDKVLSRYALEVTFEDNAQKVMANSKLLLVASGTATLQGALFQTPLIIVYRMSLFNYLWARTVIKIDHIGLVNIILGEEVCPEYVQVGARPRAIANKALTLLEDFGERDTMLSRFADLRVQLAGGGGCRRVAEISERLLEST